MSLINTPVPTFDLLQSMHQLPPTEGVYFVTGELPASLPVKPRPGDSIIHPDMLYIGATRNMQVRVERHLTDDSRASSFRMTLGAVLRENLGLVVRRHLGKPSFDFGPTEDRLTDWLVENTSFRFWPTAEPFAVERALIAHASGALNIKGRMDREAVGILMQLRRQAIATDQDYDRLLKASRQF